MGKKRITIWKSQLDLLKRDIEDMEYWDLFNRCPVCNHLHSASYCCQECGWNGEEKDIKKFKKEYKNK